MFCRIHWKSHFKNNYSLTFLFHWQGGRDKCDETKVPDFTWMSQVRGFIWEMPHGLWSEWWNGKKKKKKKSPSPWEVTSLWRLKLPHDGSSSWIIRASSLVGVLQLFTSSKDCWSMEEQTACGLIPSALTAASVFILFTAQSVPVAWSCLLVGGERRWLNWKTKKEEIRCLTLDSGCYF